MTVRATASFLGLILIGACAPTQVPDLSSDEQNGAASDAPVVAQDAYPRAIVDDCLTCIAYSSSPDDTYCDSDCDGWYDRADAAPCDPSIPGVSPEELGVESAGICEEVLGIPATVIPSVPAFEAGDVFSFLTPDETEYFRLLAASSLYEINEQIRAEEQTESDELGARLSAGSLDAVLKCKYTRRWIEMMRASTWEMLTTVERVYGRPFLPLSPGELQEVVDYNCEIGAGAVAPTGCTFDDIPCF